MFGEAIAGASGELKDLDVAPAFYTPTEYRIKWTTLQWEADEAYKLRRAVFCIEQGIFVGDDRDEIDERAQQLVAVSCLAGIPEQVVGTVRIHQEEPGVWFGSRLAVHAAFRRHGKIGATRMRSAVRHSSRMCRARMCRCFAVCVGTYLQRKGCSAVRII
jgi:putative N-acetyltransferase (TIGR04045 family)